MSAATFTQKHLLETLLPQPQSKAYEVKSLTACQLTANLFCSVSLHDAIMPRQIYLVTT